MQADSLPDELIESSISTKESLAFTDPVSLTEVQDALDDPSLGKVEVVVEADVNGETYTVGAFVEAGETLEQDATQLINENIAGSLASVSPEGDNSISRQLAQRTLPAEYEVVRATVELEGAATELSAIGAVDAFTAEEEKVAKERSADPQAEARLAAVCTATGFSPIHLGTSSGQATTLTRTLSLVFAWNYQALERLKACGNIVTYEHDFATNNYDNQSYFGGMSSWSTTMPNGYYDSSLSDAPGEKYFTIGSYDTRPVTANTNYRNFLVATIGNSSIDTAKLQGQRGQRIPEFCTNPNTCIFATATEDIISAWGLLIPSNTTT